MLDISIVDNHLHDFLEIIRKNAARMSRLSEDLLTLARVESGEQRFDIQNVSVEELLQDALESFREVARTYDVEIVVDNSAPDFNVSADREAVHQIFSNLIENALKYAASGKKIILGARPASGISISSTSSANGVEPGGSGSATVAGSPSQVPAGDVADTTAAKESDSVIAAVAVEFYVRDFGPGISSEHVPRLFERFYRVDKALPRIGRHRPGPGDRQTHHVRPWRHNSRRERAESRLDVRICGDEWNEIAGAVGEDWDDFCAGGGFGASDGSGRARADCGCTGGGDIRA